SSSLGCFSSSEEDIPYPLSSFISIFSSLFVSKNDSNGSLNKVFVYQDYIVAF
ncbi:10029_t:CDS:2, partial [Gigaspora rosea]